MLVVGVDWSCVVCNLLFWDLYMVVLAVGLLVYVVLVLIVFWLCLLIVLVMLFDFYLCL